MADIDDYIKGYYTAKTLSAEQLQTLKQAPEKAKPKGSPWQIRLAITAVVIIGACNGYQFYSSYQDRATLQDYATEVAASYHADAQPNFFAPEVSDLNQQMNRLSFKLHLPDQITDSYRLWGARYCSIGSNMAVQLKMISTEDDTVTVFVLRNKFEEPVTQSFTVNDIQVAVSNQDSLLYLVASPSS